EGAIIPAMRAAQQGAIVGVPDDATCLVLRFHQTAGDVVLVDGAAARARCRPDDAVALVILELDRLAAGAHDPDEVAVTIPFDGDLAALRVTHRAQRPLHAARGGVGLREIPQRAVGEEQIPPLAVPLEPRTAEARR